MTGRIELRRFEAADLAALATLAEAMVPPEQLPIIGEAIEKLGRSWTGVVDGQVVGCAGFIDQHPGNAKVWATFTAAIPRGAWPRIVRLIRAELARAPEARLEATCPVGFGAGLGFLRWLGFELECKARRYGPDGDHFIFALIREDRDTNPSSKPSSEKEAA
jgi:RimJ/RimL family protein N-acetyltransferase